MDLDQNEMRMDGRRDREEGGSEGSAMLYKNVASKGHNIGIATTD